jgi:hypothetical protein
MGVTSISKKGAMTLRIMTFSIKTLSTKGSDVTLSTKGSGVTLSISDRQHK